MPLYDSHPDDLTRSRVARIAGQRLARQEAYLALLRQAAGVADSSGLPHQEIDSLILAGTTDLNRLREQSNERIFPRKRPRKRRPDQPLYTVYLDECGSHSLKETAADAYPVFVLAAVIIANDDVPAVETAWSGWKSQWLGSDSYNIHEPDVRTRKGPFYEADERTLSALTSEIAATNFGAAACVFHREHFIADFGANAPDDSLPQHPYLMALDFLSERLAIILDQQFDGARAQIVAEARGPAEDALIQHEFARLHLDGTAYVGPSYFRQQFFPGIRFEKKTANIMGLQLADLLARPCGDKVIHPDSTPARWTAFRPKLCLGTETKHSILGLKVMPWRDEYVDLWKS